MNKLEYFDRYYTTKLGLEFLFSLKDDMPLLLALKFFGASEPEHDRLQYEMEDFFLNSWVAILLNDAFPVGGIGDVHYYNLHQEWAKRFDALIRNDYFEPMLEYMHYYEEADE